MSSSTCILEELSLVPSVKGTATAAVGSTFSWAGVDGLVGAFRVSIGVMTSACCMLPGWRTRCGIAVGDRYMSASSIASAALALTWWNSVLSGFVGVDRHLLV